MSKPENLDEFAICAKKNMKNLNIIAEGDDTEVVVFWQAVQDGEHCVLQLGNLLALHRPTHLVLGKRLSKDNLGLCERI